MCVLNACRISVVAAAHNGTPNCSFNSGPWLLWCVKRSNYLNSEHGPFKHVPSPQGVTSPNQDVLTTPSA